MSIFGRRSPDARFESRITWVFGSPRSGSTWLWAMLSDLEPVVAINEPQIGFYLSPFACDSPGIDASGLDMSNFTVRRMQADHPHQFFASKYEDVWGPLLGQMITERFRAQARRTKPHVSERDVAVVVKEPNGSQSADVLVSVLPRSGLLFLLRDGRDVVDSVLAALDKGSWTAENFSTVVGIGPDERVDLAVTSAHKWLWQTEVVQQAFEAHEGRKLLVRYEDLLAEPTRHLARIVEWLGVPVGEEELRALVERHSFDRIPTEAKGPTRFYRAATPGLWRENLTPVEQQKVGEILGPKLRELGYEPH